MDLFLFYRVYKQQQSSSYDNNNNDNNNNNSKSEATTDFSGWIKFPLYFISPCYNISLFLSLAFCKREWKGKREESANRLRFEKPTSTCKKAKARFLRIAHSPTFISCINFAKLLLNHSFLHCKKMKCVTKWVMTLIPYFITWPISALQFEQKHLLKVTKYDT